MALQAAGLDEESGPPPTTVTPPIAIPSDATPALSPTVSDSESEEDIPIEPAVSCYEKLDLRKWCTGQPPKRLYFKSDRGRALPPRFRMSRRNTLGDRPELDILLAATKVEYNGHSYLPLTAQTIHRLDPFFKGAKPLADMKVFECIIINQEVNGVHADHVVTALERIGEHCKHLLVMSPVQTSELGNVFAREAGLINTGNDWDAILECFPNVNYIAFVHDLEKPVGFSRNTFRGLQTAVANRQATQEELKGFSASIPPALLM
ncbi:hypothetical protein CC86DRAFT_358652 [Ophiobolus disseminans]|uniref:Uncharacterized protein n=1 Tax=Ophiobolus disseminans TaxID=1469910 RepID=A0A6A6ZLN2_9PLEO|nr:hypothetical protein CC86DRAFT_358652 [Ophiobolus disseminans]